MNKQSSSDIFVIDDVLRDISKKAGEKETLILDMGCGEGERLKFILKNNSKAVAIDKSRESIKKALKNTPSDGNIVFVIGDMKDINFRDGVFDTIIAVSSLNFLAKSDLRSVFDKIKKWTKNGGWNIINVFRDKDSNVKKKGVYLFERGELKEIYSDWGIERYQEFSFTDTKHGKPHKHDVSQIIAKKKQE